MSKDYNYLDLGYDKLLNRGNDIFDLDSALQTAGDININGISSLASSGDNNGKVLSEGSYNGDVDLVEGGVTVEQLNTGEYNEKFIVGENGQILGGVTWYDDGSGFFLGWDDGVYKFFVGDSSGDNLSYDGTDLSITGSLIAGSIHIPDKDTTDDSFHVESDGDTFWGCTQSDFTSDNDNATAYVLKSGDAKFQSLTTIGDLTERQFLDFNNSTKLLEISGKTTLLTTMTAGWDLTQGELCSVESDGNVYPTRATAIESSRIDYANMNNGGSCGYYNSLKVDDDLLFSVYIDGGGGIKTHRIEYDGEDGSIGTITAGTAMTTTSTGYPEISKIYGSTDSVIYTGINGTTLYTQVISDLDTGQTFNTEDSLSGVSRVLNQSYDSSTSFIVYQDSSTNDLKGASIGISGTTATFGSAQSLLTASSVIRPFDLKRFGDTDFYCLSYIDNSISYAVVIEFDGTTLTAGTPITIDSSTGISNKEILSIDNLDDDRMVGSYLDATGNYARVMVLTRGSSRSLTEGTNVTIDTVDTSVQGKASNVVALGTDSAIIWWVYSSMTAGVTHKSQIVRIDEATVTVVDSKVTIGTTGESTYPYDREAIKISPEYMAYIWQEHSTSQSRIATYKLETNFSSFVGVAGEDITDGSSGGIVLNGYSDDMSGLTVGDSLYLDLDGAFSTKDVSTPYRKFATTLSSTEIKIIL